MKKLLTLTALAALCAALAGCAQTMPSPQTGRSVTINQTFNRCLIKGNNAMPAAEKGGEQSLSDTMAAAGDFLSPKGGVWSQSETDGGQISTPTAATDVSPTTSMNYGGGGGDALANLIKLVAAGFTGSDGNVDWDGVKKVVIDAGHDKKAVEACVGDLCGE